MSNEQQDTMDKKSFLIRGWTTLTRPSSRYSVGGLLMIGFMIGIIYLGGTYWAIEVTNTETFCISCHEMEENVYKEYQDTIHYNNRTGVRATCPDCHVPKEWVYKIIRKVRATNEVFHKMIGSINTPKKFEAKRLELAKHVWADMKATNSRECRNCHANESMDYTKQGQYAVQQHIKGVDESKTCIDCHKGIAHSLPALYEIDPSAAIR
jgi:cytochrome c-type protein NapC